MEVTLKILRFDPLKDKKPRFQEYVVEVYEYTRVLEALIWVRENLDPSLSFRYSCRMAQCGSCGMLIDEVPRLACKTLIKDLGRDEVTIKPLPKYRVIKDLVVEMDDFFEKHRSVKPYLIRKNREEQEKPKKFYVQLPHELQRYLNYGYCIVCGLCSSSCPNFDSSWEYLGPQALSQAYRYIVDSRDEGFEERYEVLNSNSGVWRCHFASECSENCPKGVEPAQAIQMLRRMILSFSFKKKLSLFSEKIHRLSKQ